MAKVKNNRSHWFGLVLYPDNYYHVAVLQYLRSLNLDMVWIEHKAESDEKKEHIHVMIFFDSARTANGVAQSFGTCPCFENSDGTFSVVPPDSIDVMRSVKKLVDKPIISHVENISCPEEYLRYMTHSDFKSRLAGKTSYKNTDLNFSGNDRKFKNFFLTVSSNKEMIISELMGYYSMHDGSSTAVFRHLVADGRFDIIEYLEGHSYFVNTFFSSKGGD